MPRAKGGPKTRRRRKKWIKFAKGYYGKAHSCYRIARTYAMKGLMNAYIGRKNKKRDIRRLWILKINAKCREYGIPYNKFINGIKKLNIKLDRKELAKLAESDGKAFAKIIEEIKSITT